MKLGAVYDRHALHTGWKDYCKQLSRSGQKPNAFPKWFYIDYIVDNASLLPVFSYVKLFLFAH